MRRWCWRVGGRCLFTDGRYTAQAKAEAVGTQGGDCEEAAVVAACEWMEAAGVRRCGFDAAHTTVAGLEGMRKAVSRRRCGGGCLWRWGRWWRGCGR